MPDVQSAPVAEHMPDVQSAPVAEDVAEVVDLDLRSLDDDSMEAIFGGDTGESALAVKEIDIISP